MAGAAVLERWRARVFNENAAHARHTLQRFKAACPCEDEAAEGRKAQHQGGLRRACDAPAECRCKPYRNERHCSHVPGIWLAPQQPSAGRQNYSLLPRHFQAPCLQSSSVDYPHIIIGKKGLPFPRLPMDKHQPQDDYVLQPAHDQVAVGAEWVLVG